MNKLKSQYSAYLREANLEKRLTNEQITRLDKLGFNFDKQVREEARHIVCLETKMRFSSTCEAAKSIGCAPSQIRACCKSKSHYSGGFHWMYADEYDELSEYALSHIQTLGRIIKQIICVETGVRYQGYAAASLAINVSDSCIASACSSSTHYAGGFHWLHAEDYDSMSNDEIEQILLSGKRENGKAGRKCVVCVENGIRYENAKEGAAVVGGYSTNISRACKSETHYAYGFHWMYADEIVHLTEQEIANILTLGGSNKKRGVVCLETGSYYESIGGAATKYGIDSRNIVKACKRENHYTCGFHWMYADEYDLLSKEEIAHIVEHGGRDDL